jgi:hypothetical protein
MAALGGAYAALAGYLFRGVQYTGDGATYVLQAMDGSAWDRSLHVGYLASLKSWVWAAGHLGLDASTAANLLAASWCAVALLLVTILAAGLLADLPGAASQPRWYRFAPCAAPLTVLAAAASWDAALFAEVYGPLATAVLATALALRRGRDRTASLFLLLAALIHPGAWALVPGLLIATGRRADRRTARLLGMALLPWLGCLVLLAPEWWSGGRGLLALPGFERSPWQSLQAAWRLLSRDLGVGAAPVLLAAVLVTARADCRKARSWLLGVLVMGLGAALGLDRYPDNCGQLPALWMIACLSPLAVGWLPVLGETRAQRFAALAWAVLLALCIADATSRHDALARRAERANTARAQGCAPSEPDAESWREQQLRRLACSERR